MSKGHQTRQMIIEKAASLLNRQGYMAFSMSAIMSETGLEKGGIYNHFKSKEELAHLAFEHSVNTRLVVMERALSSQEHAVDRLKAFAMTFLERGSSPPGGCPLMNAAIESDDAYPELRDKVRDAMSRLHELLRTIITAGMSKREIRDDADPEDLIVLLVSTLEGALMLSKLYEDPAPLHRAIRHLHHYLDESVRREESSQ